MGSKKLSIIIPVYNSAGSLEKCVDSVLNQTYADFDLYLVDDNSTDKKTGEICDRYAKQDERVHVIHHEKNCGLSISREDGFYANSSEWVSFIDNDDLVAPDMYEELMKFASQDSIDLVCICGQNKTEEDIKNLIWSEEQSDILMLEGKEACSRIYSDQLALPLVKQMWGKLIRRSLIEQAMPDVLPYKDRLYWVFFEDVMFTPMLFYYADKVVFNNRIMYIHRVAGKTNLSLTIQPKEFHYESVEAGIVVLNFLKKHDMPDAFYCQIIGCFSNMISVWYKVWKNEKDNSRKNNYNRLVDKMFAKYGKKLKAVPNKDFATVMNKLNIMLFKLNRNLWGMTIGNVYFKLL